MDLVKEAVSRLVSVCRFMRDIHAQGVVTFGLAEVETENRDLSGIGVRSKKIGTGKSLESVEETERAHLQLCKTPEIWSEAATPD